MASSPYLYSPLKDGDSIRLIKFQVQDQTEDPQSKPAKARRWRLWSRSKKREAATAAPEDPLQKCAFDIIEVKMAEAPSYEAVSYVWGSAERCDSLQIGEHHRLPITASVLSALPRLLAAATTGYLWIDQICINQDDMSERSKQVQLMGVIFKRAKRVLAWLGEMDQHGTVSLVELMSAVAAERARYAQHGSGVSFDVFSNPVLAALLGANDEYLNALVELLNSPWFNRAWIVQEAVLCRDLQLLVGDITITDLNFLYSLIKSVYFTRPTNDRQHFALFKAAGYDGAWDLSLMRLHHHARNSSDWKFYYLLSKMSKKQVSDDRDHVYAFMGLIDEPGVVIEPDYKISLAETYIRCARAIIEGSKSLDILGTVRPKVQFQEVGSQLPTWVPDWNKTARSDPLIEDFTSTSSRENFFNACLKRQRSPSPTEDSDTKVLRIRGKHISTISFVTHRDPTSWQSTVLKNLRDKFPIDDIVAQLKLNSPMFADLTRERTARVVTVDGGGSAVKVARCQHPLTDQSICELLEEYDRILGPDQPTDDAFNKEAQSFLHRYQPLFISTTRRRVFSTMDGKLGLAPSQCLPGDQVVIAHGSRVPLVVRPAKTTGKFWLVGAAYLEDVMYGEACTWAEDEADEFILI